MPRRAKYYLGMSKRISSNKTRIKTVIIKLLAEKD